MAIPKGKRLIRIGLASLYNRKVKSQIKYMYRRVGQNPNERYSFRWQPQFVPDNRGESEYLKKRLFSWVTKERSEAGELPDSTSRPSVNKRPTERAAKYFWGYSRHGDRRMQDQTEDEGMLIRQVHKFYHKYIQQKNVAGHSRAAMEDLLRRIKQQKYKPMGDPSYTPTIRSADGAAGRSTEEKLIYLAPHLHKLKDFKTTRNEQAVVRKIRSVYMGNRTVRDQQLDVKANTPEATMIRNFLKSNEKTMIGNLRDLSDLGAGIEVTEKTIVARFGDQLDKVSKVGDLKAGSAKERYAKLRPVLQEMLSEINNPNTKFELRGEAKRRFEGNEKGQKEAASAGAYKFAIPTGAGDLLILHLQNQGDKIGLSAGLLPNVTDDLGTAAVGQYLGSELTAIAKSVIQKSSSKNQIMYDNIIMEMTQNQMFHGLHTGSTGTQTKSPFIPTYHTNIMSQSDFAGRLSNLVNEAFGGYYNSGQWQDFFDPQTQYGNNNAFRRWSMDWIAQSVKLEEDVNQAASNRWKRWMKTQVKPTGIQGSLYSWANPVSFRPFIMTSKQGVKQSTAGEMTAQGRFVSYREAMTNMFGTSFSKN